MCQLDLPFSSRWSSLTSKADDGIPEHPCLCSYNLHIAENILFAVAKSLAFIVLISRRNRAPTMVLRTVYGCPQTNRCSQGQVFSWLASFYFRVVLTQYIVQFNRSGHSMEIHIQITFIHVFLDFFLFPKRLFSYYYPGLHLAVALHP